MKTISSRSQYQEEQLAGIIDSLIFGHLQKKQYTKTLHALLSESPHLTKDATTVQNTPNQIILNVNSFLHDRDLEQIIETFYTYGRFDVPPNLLNLGKRLRDLSNEFATELAFGCHSYSNNEQRFFGRKIRTRAQQNPVVFVEQMPFNNEHTSKHAEYSSEPMTDAANGPVHNDAADMQYSHAMDAGETRVGELSGHENAHNRRKAAQPLQKSQRIMSQIVQMSNENLRDKETGVDMSSLALLEAEHFDDIFKSAVDDETLYQTLESVERDEAMEANQYSRDSMNISGGNGASFALDIPMHDEHSLPSTSVVPQYPHQPTTFPSHPHNSFSMNPHNPSISMNRSGPRPLMEQYIQHPAMMNPAETQSHNASLMPPAPPPPPPPPPADPVESQRNSALVEPEKKQSKDMRDSSWTRNGSSPSRLKTHLPPPPPPPPPLAPSTSSAVVIPPKLSSLGRIPKKGQSSAPPPPAPPLSTVSSPAVSPRAEKTVVVIDKMPEGFRMSKGKVAPTLNGNEGKRDSLDSQDTLRAEAVDSDCTVTENEDNDLPMRNEGNKMDKKNNWDDLFDDSPSTVAESNRERERREKEQQENKRRLEMRELEKKREREKRRKDKEKKEDDRREKPKEDRSRYEKRPSDDRRRDSTSRDDREDKEREDRQRKKKEQEEQRKVIDAQKRQMEIEDRARQKKKEEEDKKRELKEKEDEKRREKEKEMKKIEEERLRKEKDIKSKEEKRNELERRRRREAQLRKNVDKTPLPIGDSPLDKIAAEMDGKELRKENEFENRSTSMMGSLHSSKTGIFLDKAQKLRDTTERQQPVVIRPIRPIRPNRVQMAPMKRPPAVMADDDDDEDEEERERETPSHKKGKLEDNAIDSILNKIYR